MGLAPSAKRLETDALTARLALLEQYCLPSVIWSQPRRRRAILRNGHPGVGFAAILPIQRNTFPDSLLNIRHFRVRLRDLNQNRAEGRDIAREL